MAEKYFSASVRNMAEKYFRQMPSSLLGEQHVAHFIACHSTQTVLTVHGDLPARLAYYLCSLSHSLNQPANL